MSEVLNGNAANSSNGLTATITALAASPTTPLVRVTASAPHLFGPNDLVSIATSPLTGDFNITVIDATHFDLQGSTFTSTGTGTATDRNLTPQILVPTDGDPGSLQLSGLLSSQQGTLDRTQRLAAALYAATLRLPLLGSVQFVASGTMVVPARVTWMLAVLCGGGGGGEGGNQGEVYSGSPGQKVYLQGGGGAGAPLVAAVFGTNPGDTLTVTVGAGGTAGGAGGGAGGDGGLSSVADGAAYLAMAPGGAGCGQGQQNWSGGNFSLGAGVVAGSLAGLYTDVAGMIAPGACGLASSNHRASPFSCGPVVMPNNGTHVSFAQFVPQAPSRGGSVCVSFSSLVSSAFAWYSEQGQNAAGSQLGIASPTAGGAAGATGALLTLPPGTGGGGGGAGGYGNGGAGGAGGAASNTNGNAGTAGSVGIGGGGGGGGGGGSWGDTGHTAGAGAAGGAGGGGEVWLYWLTDEGGV